MSELQFYFQADLALNFLTMKPIDINKQIPPTTRQAIDKN